MKHLCNRTHVTTKSFGLWQLVFFIFHLPFAVFSSFYFLGFFVLHMLLFLLIFHTTLESFLGRIFYGLQPLQDVFLSKNLTILEGRKTGVFRKDHRGK